MNAPPRPVADCAAQPKPTPARRRVTDAPTRMFHALFAFSFLGAYLTADAERWRALHLALGYTLLGLLAFRLLYGLWGPRQARLAVLWRKLKGLPAWLLALPGGVAGPGADGAAASVSALGSRAAWGRQGQHLGMALSVALLLLLVLPLVFSGVALFHEWGGEAWAEFFEDLHELLGEAFALVVLQHLALIGGLSLWRRQNLALPMLTGRVAGRGPDLVKRNHLALALLLLLAVLAWWRWEWQQSPSGLLPWLAPPEALRQQWPADEH